MHSHIHSLTHSLTHSHPHSHTHSQPSLTHSLTHSLTQVQEHISTKLQRKLTKQERILISKEVKHILGQQKDTPSLTPSLTHSQQSDSDTLVPSDILILMAYSSDYTIGSVCEAVNRHYATRHGYSFECVVQSYEDMLSVIAPRTHCTWYKVYLINSLLHSQGHSHTQYKFILWIDADAIVIDHSVTIEDIIFNRVSECSSDKYEEGVDGISKYSSSDECSSDVVAPDLIVSTDMSEGSSCPLNCGVLLIRVSEWSVQLWKDVWEHPSSLKYKVNITHSLTHSLTHCGATHTYTQSN